MDETNEIGGSPQLFGFLFGKRRQSGAYNLLHTRRVISINNRLYKPAQSEKEFTHHNNEI
jgi:hypothetical protein